MQSGPVTRPEQTSDRAVRRWLEVLFWGPLGVAVLLVVAWPPRTVDGPAHLLGAAVLAGYDEPGTAFDRYYLIDWTPTPNLAGSALLAALVEVSSLRVAETVLLVACATGLPLALRFAIQAVAPGSAWLAVAGLPLGFGYLYFYGFVNFCLGLVLFLLGVGVALRAAPRWSGPAAAGLTVLLTATWFTHLVPFGIAVMFLACLAVTGPRHPSGRRVRTIGVPALAALPGLALTVAYAARTDQGASPTWDSPGAHLLGLVSLHAPLVTFTVAENVIGVLLAAGLVAVSVLARRGPAGSVAGGSEAAPTGRFAAAAAVLATVGYLLAPTSLGIDFGLINERLSYFPVLLGLLWLAARPLPARQALAGALALVALMGALLAVRVPDLRRYDRMADEYDSAAGFVDRGSTLVALRLASYPPEAGRNSHWDPLRHLSSRVAAETGSVDVGHYEAVLDYFPARFRPAADLRRAIDPDLGGLGQVPPRAEVVAAISGEPIDYVLLVGASDAGDSAAAVRAELAGDYDRIGVTAPTGLVEVWAARES